MNSCNEILPLAEIPFDELQAYETENQTTITYRVCVPRMYRSAIQVSLPSHIPKEIGIETLTKGLQEVYPKNFIYIAEYSVKTSEDKNLYTIVYFTIPEELLNQFKTNQINKCIFYITTSQNIQAFKIQTYEPDDSEIAYTNLEGRPMSYKSSLIEFNFQ